MFRDEGVVAPRLSSLLRQKKKAWATAFYPSLEAVELPPTRAAMSTQGHGSTVVIDEMFAISVPSVHHNICRASTSLPHGGAMSNIQTTRQVCPSHRVTRKFGVSAAGLTPVCGKM